MFRSSLSAFACASVLILSGFAAQAGEGGGGGGDDRWAQPAQAKPFNPAPWPARPGGRDFAESSHRGGSHFRSVDQGADIRNVTETKRNGKVKRTVSVGGGLPYAEITHPDGTRVRSEGPRRGHKVTVTRPGN